MDWLGPLGIDFDKTTVVIVVVVDVNVVVVVKEPFIVRMVVIEIITGMDNSNYTSEIEVSIVI